MPQGNLSEKTSEEKHKEFYDSLFIKIDEEYPRVLKTRPKEITLIERLALFLAINRKYLPEGKIAGIEDFYEKEIKPHLEELKRSDDPIDQALLESFSYIKIYPQPEGLWEQGGREIITPVNEILNNRLWQLFTTLNDMRKVNQKRFYCEDDDQEEYMNIRTLKLMDHLFGYLEYYLIKELNNSKNKIKEIGSNQETAYERSIILSLSSIQAFLKEQEKYWTDHKQYKEEPYDRNFNLLRDYGFDEITSTFQNANIKKNIKDPKYYNYLSNGGILTDKIYESLGLEQEIQPKVKGNELSIYNQIHENKNEISQEIIDKARKLCFNNNIPESKMDQITVGISTIVQLANFVLGYDEKGIYKNSNEFEIKHKPIFMLLMINTLVEVSRNMREEVDKAAKEIQAARRQDKIDKAIDKTFDIIILKPLWNAFYKRQNNSKTPEVLENAENQASSSSQSVTIHNPPIGNRAGLNTIQNEERNNSSSINDEPSNPNNHINPLAYTIGRLVINGIKVVINKMYNTRSEAPITPPQVIQEQNGTSSLFNNDFAQKADQPGFNNSTQNIDSQVVEDKTPEEASQNNTHSKPQKSDERAPETEEAQKKSSNSEAVEANPTPAVQRVMGMENQIPDSRPPVRTIVERYKEGIIGKIVEFNDQIPPQVIPILERTEHNFHNDILF